MKNSSDKEHFSFQLSDNLWRSNNERIGESKLSSKILFGEDIKKCKFLILGISEDIGPQMNNGFPRANSGFKSFVSALQNVQSNDFLIGDEIGFLGEIIQNQNFKSLEINQGWIEELDDFVFKTLQYYSSDEQTIIVVGGGHNNAYPLLKHVKETSKESIHSINIDPHADCRATDFRHSGNPFSFAFKDDILEDYSIIGLHESYNNQFILDFAKKQHLNISFFEEFLDDEVAFWNNLTSFSSSLNQSQIHTLDLDLDSIAFAPSSALTPSGFSIEDCRRIIRKLSSAVRFNYFHLPEGAPTSEVENRNYGKMICYFVLDFIKCQNKFTK